MSIFSKLLLQNRMFRVTNDKMKIEEQKKAVRSGYDMDISATRS